MKSNALKKTLETIKAILSCGFCTAFKGMVQEANKGQSGMRCRPRSAVLFVLEHIVLGCGLQLGLDLRIDTIRRL